jgi:hypothetical protein
MRIRALLLPAALACLALASSGTGAIAQSSPFNFFDLFRPRPPQQYYQPAQPRRVNPYVQKKKAPAPRTVIVEDTNKPKVDPGTFVMVVGDSLSELLAQGLEEAVSDKPDIAVVDKSKGDSGLVNSEFYDWPKAVGELLNGKDKISLGVMMVGANDRQAIREGGESHAPGTPKWEQIYAARIDSIVKAFAEKKIPLIWVGMPPMKSDRISTDMVALNTLFRDHVQAGGGVFVDVWEAFADDENRYTAFGPGLSGQNTKLRTADGVHFTKAGARKLAHFVDVELKRLIDTQPPTVVALPSQPSGRDADLSIPGNLERMIDQAIKPVPELKGGVALPVKPVAGPIIPLNKPDAAPGGALVNNAQQQRGGGEAGVLIERVFSDGRVPEPRSGRADDFRWPKQGP